MEDINHKKPSYNQMFIFGKTLGEVLCEQEGKELYEMVEMSILAKSARNGEPEAGKNYKPFFSISMSDMLGLRFSQFSLGKYSGATSTCTKRKHYHMENKDRYRSKQPSKNG